MLIRFGASNFFSIKDYIELSMVASTALQDETRHLRSISEGKIQLVPSVLLYGGNGSGKTSVVSAIRSMRRHIIESATSRKPGEKLGHTGFLLAPDAMQIPTRFDCDVIVEGVRYHYGFEYGVEGYNTEWLFSYPEGLPRQLFMRDESGEIKFGRTLKGANKQIERLMRRNALFLSVAAQNSHPELLKLYQFFEKKFRFVASQCEPAQVQVNLPKEGNIDRRIVDFLKLADTGIYDSRIEARVIDDESRAVAKRLTDFFADMLPADSRPDFEADEVRRELKFGHVAKDLDELVYISLFNESRGTIRLVELLTDALYVLDNGGVLVVDELDSSLHTVIACDFVKLFNSQNSSKKFGQIIATTHDTNLLDLAEVRRDQIWFVQKSPWGETTLFPLADIKTRKGESLERAYMRGRFGALPSAPVAGLDMEVRD